jgi:hypothetical protein
MIGRMGGQMPDGYFITLRDQIREDMVSAAVALRALD